MKSFFRWVHFLTFVIALMFAASSLVSGTSADEPVSALNPLAASVMRLLKGTPDYRELETLYKNQRKQDRITGRPSARSRRLHETLKRLRAAAASTSMIDPENPKGERVVNFSFGVGNISRLGSLVPSTIDSDESVHRAAASVTCRFILTNAIDEGLIPFDLPPEIQATVDAAMNQGYEAAKQENYLVAITHFEEARAIAPHNPDIYYNLGLAEAKIPGRELRAVTWFGAYLAADPGSPQAPAIQRKIQTLMKEGPSRFLTITEEVFNQISDQSLKDIYLEQMAEFWAMAGHYADAFHTANSIENSMWFGSALAKIAGAEARAGDIDGALETAAMIPSAESMSSARQSIADAQLSLGDIPGAIATAKGIQAPFYKILSQHRIANAQTAAGDPSAALQTLTAALSVAENIESETLKSLGQQDIAVSQAKAGDFTEALRVADSISDPFNVSLAKQTIAELQAKAGDAEGAQQTLAAALEAADKVEDKSIVMQAYAEAKWRIDTGNLGDPNEQPIVKPPLPVSAPHWVYLNDTAFNLNTPFFLDLSAAMKTLPKEDRVKITDALEEMATKLVEACETLSCMLKQQEKGAVLS